MLVTHNSLLAVALLAGGCATSAPAERTQLPAAAPHVQPAPQLRVASTLAALSLSCQQAEQPRANALDDDCDGKVDALSPGAALAVSWAAAPGAELAVSLLDAHGQPLPATHDSRGSACTNEGAVVSATSFQQLPPGAAKLVLAHVRACADPSEPTSAVISISQGGRSRSYTVAVAPGQTLDLAELTAP